MLTSFFASSKPVNNIVVILYMIMAFFAGNKEALSMEFSLKKASVLLGSILMYLLAMGLYSFIIRKNDLTGAGSYKILLFATFTALIPMAFLNVKILCAGVFVLLAVRRLISLRSGIAIERKLYDASFWLTVATLCYFWSIIFFIPLFLSIFLYARGSIRYWFIPILGIATILLFMSCYVLYIEGDQSYILDYIDEISFDFSKYSNLKVLLPLSFLCSVFIWSVWKYITLMNTTVFSQRGSYLLVVSFALAALVIVLFCPNKSGAEWYFFIPALAIIATKYIELSEGLIFKEFLLWGAILLPVMVYFF